MKLLLTNDDGLESRGIQFLAETLEKRHDVYIVAPDRNRSGVSQSITLHHTLEINYISDKQMSCSGTPSDCVLAAIKGKLLPWTPDLVLSGINHGPNAANDILYSGTCAAARQASMMNIPAIAISIAEKNPEESIDNATRYIDRHLESLFNETGQDFFLNINFPAGFSGDAKIQSCVPGRRYYQDEYRKLKETGNKLTLELIGNPFYSEDRDGFDTFAIDRGYISLSRIHAYPLVHQDSMFFQAAEERNR